MKKCLDCGLTFGEPKQYSDTHGLVGGLAERWSGCPRCAGAFEEAAECDICHTIYPKSEFSDCSDGNICNSCFMIMIGDDEE